MHLFQLLDLFWSHHDESLLNQLQLRYQLLLLHLKLVKSRRTLGSVRLKKMSLLNKVDLQLLLKLWYKLLQLLPPSISSLLNQLLQLSWAETREWRTLKQLMHLLETWRKKRKLEWRHW